MKLNTSTKSALLALVNATLVAVLIGVAAVTFVQRGAPKDASEAAGRNMRTAWTLPDGEGIKLVDGKLMAGGTRLDANFILVDKIGELGGGATIFRGDTRVATNIKKEDGSLADDIGDMARAVEGFRIDALEKRKLEEAQKREIERERAAREADPLRAGKRVEVTVIPLPGDARARRPSTDGAGRIRLRSPQVNISPRPMRISTS